MGKGQGITPACAGKREGSAARCRRGWDHPRMRGEKSVSLPLMTGGRGSPPHARGKENEKARGGDVVGITPACAGKSPSRALRRSPLWDHPRMRGEKHLIFWRQKEDLGSPPHARGKDIQHKSGWRCERITPACAGKSVRCHHFDRQREDHPRMRGEKPSVCCRPCRYMGSPPHARGKGRCRCEAVPALRITPACAGKSFFMPSTASTAGDHPRMRGEKHHGIVPITDV